MYYENRDIIDKNSTVPTFSVIKGENAAFSTSQLTCLVDFNSLVTFKT